MNSAIGLSKLTVDQVKTAMQVSEANPMVGIEGRAQLLVQLGKVLSDVGNAKYFAPAETDASDIPRCGHIVDYLRAHPDAQQIPSPTSLPISVPLEALWEALVHGIGGVWPPSRTKLEGVALGDVWKCDSLRHVVSSDDEALVPFHKLTQWLK